MQIEQLSIDALKPYAGNARTHSAKQIKLIAESIKRFGFNNPILIDDEGQVIAGHGRLAAASMLSLETVPCVRLSHLNEADKRAYVLADNRLAEKAGWDNSILAIELKQLADVGFDIDLTGFEAPRLTASSRTLTTKANSRKTGFQSAVRALPSVASETCGGSASMFCSVVTQPIPPSTTSSWGANGPSSFLPTHLITFALAAMYRGWAQSSTANSPWLRGR
ncbi:ParB/Srx family N-terminal domain-containing protein [Bradyrhizobium sp. 40]|uniref:ParB/Srx family N-terminal domain-containing protein n=1 Tax=Bradyrhizobium sp. 40 TaxID=2782674 RepID=UPI0020002C8F|nr:ParB/Srx family N-terminal domain-containing protein [Bradyrhizobium sp. 40]